MPVIAPVELHEHIASGCPTRDADRAHGRLGAGAHEPYHFDRRVRLRDRFGDLDLAGRRCSVARPPSGGGGNGLHHGRRGVTEDEGPPRPDVVDVRPTVDVPETRALGARDGKRLAADTPKGTDGAVDPAWNQPLGDGKDPLRFIHRVSSLESFAASATVVSVPQVSTARKSRRA